MGYLPAWNAFRASGAELRYIPLRDGVIDLEAMERECRTGKIRLIYVTPLHQYPTTTTLSIPDRARLYQIASQNNVPILEDDYDHEFHYDTQPFAPMAASDPSNLILYCSTFSKILYPSSRLGFVAVPETIFHSLNSLRRVVTRQNDCWLQDAVAAWMKDGGFARHLRRMRKLYEHRRNFLHELLLDDKGKGLEIDWLLPSGGMSLWLNTHCNSDELAKNLARGGVHVMPESHYRSDHRAGPFLRLGYACLNDKEMRHGTKALVAEVKKLQRKRD
jgi:GntR family transcriptional regulator/MocR family aminotransferase